MKTVSQLAKNLGQTYYKIAQIIRQEGIVCDISMPKRRVNQHQEEIIQQILIYEGKLDCFIFESKMNKPEPQQESWESFKKRTYGRK